MPVISIFENSDLQYLFCLIHIPLKKIRAWETAAMNSLISINFKLLQYLQTVWKILGNIYETFAVRLTDCSSVIESCDIHAVVGGLLLYHKAQSPSSTASLPLTQLTPSNCVHLWLCIYISKHQILTFLPPPEESDSCSYFFPEGLYRSP